MGLQEGPWVLGKLGHHVLYFHNRRIDYPLFFGGFFLPVEKAFETIRHLVQEEQVVHDLATAG